MEQNFYSVIQIHLSSYSIDKYNGLGMLLEHHVTKENPRHSYMDEKKGGNDP